MSDQNQKKRLRKIQFLTILSAIINLTLGIVKMVVGQIAYSQSLFADGLHSLADLLTDLLVYLAARMSGKDPDSNHPYGHERFETAGTLIVSLLLIMTGGGILLDLIEHIHHTVNPNANLVALIVIMISILANELLFQLTNFVGKQIKSDLLQANALHHRSDALSSMVVLIGVIGSYYGSPWFDTVAAIFVAGVIIKMGIDLSWRCIKELVDTAVSPAVRDAIKEIISTVEGVQALHELRTRHMSNKVLVDVHLIVSPRITVSEGHFIGDQVRLALRHHIPDIQDVTVHIDPEDDEMMPLGPCYITRSEIEAYLETTFPTLMPEIVIQVHYLKSGVELDLIFPKRLKDIPCDALKESIKNHFSEISSVRVLLDL